MVAKNMFQTLLIPMFSRIVTKYPNFIRITHRIKFGDFAKNDAKYSVFVLNLLSKYRIRSLELSSISFAFPFVVKAWGNQKDPKAQEKKVLEEADQLFNESKFDKLNELLKSQPSWYDNNEVLWRAARCEYHLSKTKTDPKLKTQLIEEAYLHVLKSLELCEECGPAHKWAAILLNEVSTMKGTRAKVEQVLNVRKHMEKAIQYSPNDPTAHYLLGEWHYSCNQVSWVERKLAAVIYGSLPEANLEIGLQALEKAEEIENDFYSKNKVLIAKTLVALNRNIPRAKSLLISVIGKYKNSDKWDDLEAVKEAQEMLKKLGVKVELI